MEQHVRTAINNQLQNLGWVLEGAGINVFQEQPRTDSEKSALRGKRPDYVLYSRDTNRKEPLIVIEAKNNKKNAGDLDRALKQAGGYGDVLNAHMIFATDGIFYRTKHQKTGKPLLYNGEELDELIRECLALQYTQTNTIDKRPEKVRKSQKELIHIFASANDSLRKDGMRAGIERFSEFSNILFLKLISEKAEQNDNNLPEHLTWNYLKELTPVSMLDHVNNITLRELGKQYNDPDILPSKLIIRNPLVLSEIVGKLDDLYLTDINSDVKGNAFEYFLKDAASTRNDLGEYFTPRHIIKTMVNILNPSVNQKIYDPFCGTGGMLIESFRHIRKTMPHTEKNLRILRQETIYGNEITSSARIAKMNMILMGDGHSNVKQCDSLAQDNFRDIEGQYDVVISNIPYSQKTDHAGFYDIPGASTDSICLQHCVRALTPLKDGGGMAVIVPQTILSSDRESKTREYLMNRARLKYVISLPKGVFQPYALVKTAILVFDNIETRENRKSTTWFYSVKNDGYSLDNYRIKMKERSDLDKIMSFKGVSSKDKPDYGFDGISHEKIQQTDFSWFLPHYKDFYDTSKQTHKLKDVLLTMETGGRPKGGAVGITEGVLSIGGEHINTDGHVDTSNPKYVPHDYYQKSKRGFVKNRDVLMCKDGALSGKVAYIPHNFNTECMVNEHVFILRAKESILKQEYLFFTLFSEKGQ